MPDKKGNPTETEIRNGIKEYLQWNKWFVITMYQSALSYNGIADLYAIKSGVSIWLEVKKPKGKQSQDQIAYERDIKEHGGSYYVVRSIEDAQRIIESIKNMLRIWED